jgi:hypothetical protein
MTNTIDVDIDMLVSYGIKRARPRFCEVILSRFVGRIRREATSVEDVDRIYQEMKRGDKDAGHQKPKIIT